MTVSFSQLRANLQAKIEELDGFRISKQSPDFFGRTQDTIAHKAFSIGLAISRDTGERQRRGVGTYIETPIQVIFSYRNRPLDIYPTDYDLALDTEEMVINKILEAYTTNKEFTIRYVSSLRQVTDSQEYTIIRLEFTALHTI